MQSQLRSWSDCSSLLGDLQLDNDVKTTIESRLRSLFAKQLERTKKLRSCQQQLRKARRDGRKLARVLADDTTAPRQHARTGAEHRRLDTDATGFNSTRSRRRAVAKVEEYVLRDFDANVVKQVELVTDLARRFGVLQQGHEYLHDGVVLSVNEVEDFIACASAVKVYTTAIRKENPGRYRNDARTAQRVLAAALAQKISPHVSLERRSSASGVSTKLMRHEFARWKDHLSDASVSLLNRRSASAANKCGAGRVERACRELLASPHGVSHE